MGLFHDAERATAEALVRLGYCNPFLPERIEYERTILGDRFVGPAEPWHKHCEDDTSRPNLALLTECAKNLSDAARERLLRGTPAGTAERQLYEDTVFSYLFLILSPGLFRYIEHAGEGASADAMIETLYNRFLDDVAHYLMIPGALVTSSEADHVFACFFQLRRAFHHIYENIIGGSMVAAQLRASVWQSIFTCDMRRYRRALYARMGDIATLVTGPSGTGKELVARAIGLSRYIPFNPKAKRFAADFTKCFCPINLSAVSPALIESELFGHTKGSFTGAVADRAGFFELCPADGAVFLDEIGDLDPAIQVKLLRVLQTRIFQRVGDPAVRRFEGKVVAATNRDLAKQMQEGRFRADLYYRLCSDIIVTPALRDQIEDSPEQLHNLLLFITRRVAGPEEAEPLAEEVARWIRENLPPDYPWPGNVRELEQCVRNIMVRKTYHPAAARAAKPREVFLNAVGTARLTAEQLLRRYCTLVYAETGSYVETARRLGIDRRTVKSRMDADFLEALRTG